MRVKFISGSQSEYDALPVRDPGALYFVSDTNRLYKGDSLYSEQIKSVTTLPSAIEAVTGFVYLLLNPLDHEDVKGYIRIGTELIKIFSSRIESLDGFVDNVLEKSPLGESGELVGENNKLPTSGAVQEALSHLSQKVDNNLVESKEYTDSKVDEAKLIWTELSE